MKKTAIVILHFGDVEDTLQCLKSVEKVKKRDFTVYVVDNGTHTLQKNMLHMFSYRPVLIKNQQNLGYAGGNNSGIKYALRKNHKYILLLNNDTTVSSQILDDLLSSFRDDTVGIIGCIITYANNPQKIWFAGGKLNKLLCLTSHPFMNRSMHTIPPQKGETDFVTGAAMMVKSEVFRKIGLFDESYFLYWEDVDFCYRAKKAEYASFLVQKPLVRHKVSASSGKKGSNKLSPLRAYYYARNPFLFIKKNSLNQLTGALGQLFILPIHMVKTSEAKAIFSYLKGFIDGIQYFY